MDPTAPNGALVAPFATLLADFKNRQEVRRAEFGAMIENLPKPMFLMLPVPTSRFLRVALARRHSRIPKVQV
jgi:hypothetical protein